MWHMYMRVGSTLFLVHFHKFCMANSVFNCTAGMILRIHMTFPKLLHVGLYFALLIHLEDLFIIILAINYSQRPGRSLKFMRQEPRARGHALAIVRLLFSW